MSEFETDTIAYGLAALGVLRPHLHAPAYAIARRLGRETEHDVARRQFLPRLDREGKLEACCRASLHAVSSLLAVREGLTDELLATLREDLQQALALPREGPA